MVFSQNGRDRGRAFVVVGVPEQNYILIADGNLRKIEKPKKKNLRHIKVSHMVLDQICETINKGERPDNSIIKNNIRSILENEESTGKEV